MTKPPTMTSDEAAAALRDAVLYAGQLKDALALGEEEIEAARAAVGLRDVPEHRERLAAAQAELARLTEELLNAEAAVRLATHREQEARAREDAARRAVAYREAVAHRAAGEALRDRVHAELGEIADRLVELDRLCHAWEGEAAASRRAASCRCGPACSPTSAGSATCSPGRATEAGPRTKEIRHV